MRISIRRCLSMLRNTSDGNELAVPLPMPSKVHSVSYWNSTVSCACVGVPRTSARRCAGGSGDIVLSRQRLSLTFPVATSRVNEPAALQYTASLGPPGGITIGGFT